MNHFITRYRPLIVLFMVSAGAGLGITIQAEKGFHDWMHGFMGVLLCGFAMLKLFNPDAFAKGFAKYDILAKRSKLYGYIYPYIELTLGLLYLSHIAPTFTYTATIIVFSFGSVGVLHAIKNKLDINCPCMGTILNVPLSTVTLSEDIIMVLMAVYMLVV